MSAGLLVHQRTGMLFEVIGRTESAPKELYSHVSAFATDGFIVFSDPHLSVCFTAWPLLHPEGWPGDPAPEVRPPLGLGCRWCGYGQREHSRWSTQPVGFHTWSEPTAAQVNRRLALRFEMRPPRRRGRLPA